MEVMSIFTHRRLFDPGIRRTCGASIATSSVDVPIRTAWLAKPIAYRNGANGSAQMGESSTGYVHDGQSSAGFTPGGGQLWSLA
jgi:hypothetical protein